MTTIIIDKTNGDILRKYVCDRTTAYYEVERLKKQHGLTKCGHNNYENEQIEVLMYNE